MTRTRRWALRQRLVAGALVVAAPLAPAVSGSTTAHLVVGAYAMAVTLFLAGWMYRQRGQSALTATDDAKADALAQEVQRVSALLDAGRAVNSARELDSVLQTILDNAVKIAAAGSGSVMLCDDRSLTVVAAVGNDRALGQRLGLGDGIAGRVAMTRAPMLVEGKASASRFPGLVDRSSPLDSALSIPMVDRDELVGVLNLGAAMRTFDDVDLETLAAFGESAAAAISKARLYEASRRATAELAHRATHDSLTGLPNRALLRERVSAVAASAASEQRGALLFVDLDGFKMVNDDFGHAAGDWLLTVAADRVRRACPTTAIAARVGGDEFAVLLTDIDTAEDALEVAHHILDALRVPIACGGDPVAISASIGIALMSRHAGSYAELMAAADAALYDAKRAGKNCCHVAEEGASLELARLPRPRRAPMAPVRGDHVPR